jgi:hypothetical protein
MDAASQAIDDDQIDGRQSPLTVDVRRLKPLEIVLARRFVHDMPLDGFPAFDGLAEQLEQQLEALPQADLPFAQEVYGTFASSPYAIDRLNVGLMLRPLTLVDHATGFALWNQLVRDEHPTVRRDVYQPIQNHLERTDRSAEEGLAEEGLTLADGHHLRNAFIGAFYIGGCHVVAETDITATLQEATHSFDSIARL